MEKEERREKIYAFIREYINKYGYAPSRRDICNALNINSSSTVQTDLNALDQCGLISLGKDKSRAIKIVDNRSKTEERPVLPEEEDKQYICELLLPALQATRSLFDLKALHFDADEEVVTATFYEGFTKNADVTADSGIAMIKDIIKQIV